MGRLWLLSLLPSFPCLLLQQKQRTALCLVGNARTLPRREAHESLFRFLTDKELDVTGLRGGRGPDVFAYVTLEGAGPKGQKGWDFRAANVTRQEVLDALQRLGPVAVATDSRAEEVTEENIDSYVLHKECFANGFWKKSPGTLQRSLNQLVHMQRCLDLVLEQEKNSSQSYDAVILARPDLFYHTGHHAELNMIARENAFLSQKDWVMAMPRWMASYLLEARPLRCSPGEACCGRIGQSEELWEYLMGVRPDNRRSCNCGPNGTWTVPVNSRTDWVVGRIVRPERAAV